MDKARQPPVSDCAFGGRPLCPVRSSCGPVSDLPCSPVGKSMGARRFCLTRLSRQPALADVDPMYNSPIFWVAAFAMSSGPSCGRPWGGLLIESPPRSRCRIGAAANERVVLERLRRFMLPPPVRASASFRSF